MQVYLDESIALQFAKQTGYYSDCFPLFEFVDSDNVEMVNTATNEYVDAIYMVKVIYIYIY